MLYNLRLFKKKYLIFEANHDFNFKIHWLFKSYRELFASIELMCVKNLGGVILVVHLRKKEI